jgi:hypothetical protein
MRITAPFLLLNCLNTTKMKKLIILTLGVSLLSCKNGSSQSTKAKPQHMYTEQELQEAVRKAREEQKNTDDAISTVMIAGERGKYEEQLREAATVPKIYYVFGIIQASYSRPSSLPSPPDHYSYSTKIMEYSHKPTRDDEYRILDDLDRTDQISIDRKVYYDFKIHKRKVFLFTSYADASEKQQEINKYGLD